MATTITALTALGAAPATGDILPIVDVSDTTQSVNGSTKKLTVANLFAAPTISAPNLSGIVTQDGAQVVTASAMGALSIDVTKALNTKTVSADTTFTFSVAPATSSTVFQLAITNGGATSRTMTLPALCLDAATLAAASTATLPASGGMTLTFRWDGTNYITYGIPATTTGTGSTVLATSPTLVTPALGTPASGNLSNCTQIPHAICIAVGDETTAITTGTAKVTFRMPYAMTLTAVRASLTTVSSSGTPTVDINEGGTTILSTKLTIDANEKTSTTAAAAAVISDSALADDAEITIDIDVAGTGAAGLKVYLIGTKT